MNKLLLLCSLLMMPVSLAAMEPRTEHTYQLASGETAPDVSLDQVAWLSGTWRGEGFGTRFEETWHPPSQGSMVGMFKLLNDAGVEFYELMTLTSDDGRLSLKVKHFSEDFTAWEDKSEYINFKLVGIEDNAVHFSGISFYRDGPNRIIGYVVMQSGGKLSEEKLLYTRGL